MSSSESNACRLLWTLTAAVLAINSVDHVATFYKYFSELVHAVIGVCLFLVLLAGCAFIAVTFFVDIEFRPFCSDSSTACKAACGRTASQPNIPFSISRPEPAPEDAALLQLYQHRKFQQIVEISDEMLNAGTRPSPGAMLIMLKSALKLEDLNRAVRHMIGLKGEKVTIPSVAVAQFVTFVCRQHRLQEFFPICASGLRISTDLLHVMLDECLRLEDTRLCQSVERTAREQNVPFDTTTYLLLLRGQRSCPDVGQQLCDEMLRSSIPVSDAVAVELFDHWSSTGLVRTVYKALRGRSRPIGFGVRRAARQAFERCGLPELLAELEQSEQAMRGQAQSAPQELQLEQRRLEVPRRRRQAAPVPATLFMPKSRAGK